MRELPILMSGLLVRATLAGQKTQTRRPIKDGPDWRDGGRWTWTASSTDRKAEGCFNYSYPDPNGNTYADRGPEKTVFSKRCPMGLAGDQLWVRETWRIDNNLSRDRYPQVVYRADEGFMVARNAPAGVRLGAPNPKGDIWTPSIHMPRWACRLVLPLVSVRVERVQSISEADAIAEGLRRSDYGWTDGTTGYDTVSAREAFRELWDSIYGTWDANPWVAVYEWGQIEVSR